MNKRYLVALDQGTTSSRAVVFTIEGRMIGSAAQEFPQHYPNPGWVEHDPGDILSTQIESLRAAVRNTGIDPAEIAAIGITNQRETTVLWDRKTGAWLHNAIVWQCRRTAPYVEKLVRDGHAEMIREKTGLVPDAYFAGTKLQWLLDALNVRDRARRGELCFGTIDSFLAWHLVQGHPHVTDATNAGRTMLFNLHTQQWDDELLQIMDIPREVLPQVVDSSQVIGMLDEDILGVPVPVAAMAGDQHAALFGQACFERGMAKNTYGTGCFMLMNAGGEFKLSENGLLTTIGIQISGETQYALEGSVFVGGAVIQWLRDEMRFFSESRDAEYYAGKVKDTGGVYLVPAFTGLGAPHWDMYARGCLIGLTRGTTREHIIRAAQESIAYQVNDLLTAMKRDTGVSLSSLSVDGGASRDSFLMQFQSDISDCTIRRPVIRETTALGACYLAGLATGVWHSREELKQLWRCDTLYAPSMDENKRRKLLSGWDKAVGRSLDWAEH